MTTERKLASVVKIVDIQPIVGADAIVVASVKGWKVVVKLMSTRLVIWLFTMKLTASYLFDLSLNFYARVVISV